MTDPAEEEISEDLPEGLAESARLTTEGFYAWLDEVIEEAESEEDE